MTSSPRAGCQKTRYGVRHLPTAANPRARPRPRARHHERRICGHASLLRPDGCHDCRHQPGCRCHHQTVLTTPQSHARAGL
eukprot:1187670-Prorocentrum_minimum.AAC.5